MDYTIEYVGDKREKNDILFVTEEPFGLVGDFLLAESDLLNQYLAAIDDVLDGKEEKDESEANIFFVRIEKGNSYIEEMYPDDEKNPEHCTVNTQELRQVIVEYLEKRKEFSQAKREGRL